MSITNLIKTGEFSSNNDQFPDHCDAILEGFKLSDDIVQAGRNTLKKVPFKGNVCVVKSFRIPSFPQNYSYGLFFKSKAKKSYDNAVTLLKLGFFTPVPVGFFESRNRGKLKSSYYVCEYAQGTQTLFELWHNNTPPNTGLIQEFTQFCVQLHSQGVLHRDFNPKNVLVSQENGVFKFSLVDINRISWCKSVSLDNAMKSLSRLRLPAKIRTTILETYASLTGADLDRCQTLFEKAELKTHRYFQNKARLRKIFPKK